MSDNEYADGDGGEEYDVFANEDDDPQVDEAAPLEADPGDMDVVDAGEAGGAGLRSADDRITTKYMTKYERARVLGTRALQIRCGALVFGQKYIVPASTTETATLTVLYWTTVERTTAVSLAEHVNRHFYRKKFM